MMSGHISIYGFIKKKNNIAHLKKIQTRKAKGETVLCWRDAWLLILRITIDRNPKLIVPSLPCLYGWINKFLTHIKSVGTALLIAFFFSESDPVCALGSSAPKSGNGNASLGVFRFSSGHGKLDTLKEKLYAKRNTLHAVYQKNRVSCEIR
jgi:hypothetical protein